MKYLAKDGFYSMCTQEKETKTVAKDFFFFFNVRLLLKKTSANSSYSQSLLTFFFLKVRCTPFYCFMACFFYLFIIILKKKSLSIYRVQIQYEPHRHYQTGQSMALPNPSDHLITFTLHHFFVFKT